MKKSEFEKILQKYGKAFMLVNKVEFLLEGFIRKHCGFSKLHEETANLILFRKTFGGKFELAKPNFKNTNLKIELEQLIKKRNKLAHSFLTPLKHDGESFLALIQKLTVEKIDEEFFQEVIESSNKIIEMFENKEF
jgi:hypothetical protein